MDRSSEATWTRAGQLFLGFRDRDRQSWTQRKMPSYSIDLDNSFKITRKMYDLSNGSILVTSDSNILERGATIEWKFPTTRGCTYDIVSVIKNSADGRLLARGTIRFKTVWDRK